MLTLRQISLSRGNKVLLNQASVSLYEKQKIGLIGHNGCGKSTLFDFLLGKLGADSGEFLINPKLRISHLSQQLPESDEQAIEFVLQGDKDYTNLMAQLAEAEQSGDDAGVLACHELLTQSGGYSKPAQAASIMSGLGFTASEQGHSVNGFSGGWRMRLSLARCLMSPADLLLLDEPTNHLDMEAIFWLERFLKQSPATIILISHDRDFLDAFVTHILHVENQSLQLYTGNYSSYEVIHALQLEHQQLNYERQQTKIAHMMSFVSRFKAKASKAKQAQSRVKAIEKMELVAAAQIDSPFSFEFYPCPRAGTPLLQCKMVHAGYQPNLTILKNINFTLNPGDRLALLGPNGEGKSTFIKTLTGTLEPLQGELFRSPHLKIGYYAQHQLEDLDSHLSPVQTIQNLSPEVREQAIRDFLGGFNFIGDMATHPIKHFSGGEKARLALAKLVWQKPNVLLLDEPTNHLDLGMRSAIEIALQSYEGALILISHDRHLLKTSVDDFYLVYQQKVQEFDGDIDDYHTWLQKKPGAQDSVQPKESTAALSHKDRKALQNKIKKVEQEITQLQKQIAEVDELIAHPDLYSNQSQLTELDKLSSKRNAIEIKLEQLEEEWFDVSAQLE